MNPCSFNLSTSKQLQKYYHSFYTENCHAMFMNQIQNNPSNYHKARMLSIQGEIGGLFLIAGPKKHFKFSRKEFLTAAWLRLGIPFKHFPSSYVCKCEDNRTFKSEAGIYAQHCFVCKKGNEKNKRHDTIRDIIIQLARHANVTQVVREPRNLFATNYDEDNNKNNQSRPDILVKDMPFDNLKLKHRFFRDEIIDVAVTYPATFNCIKNGSASVQGSASNYIYTKKFNKYKKLIKYNNHNKPEYIIAPMIFEVFGFIHTESESFLRRLIN